MTAPKTIRGGGERGIGTRRTESQQDSAAIGTERADREAQKPGTDGPEQASGALAGWRSTTSCRGRIRHRPGRQCEDTRCRPQWHGGRVAEQAEPGGGPEGVASSPIVSAIAAEMAAPIQAARTARLMSPAPMQVPTIATSGPPKPKESGTSSDSESRSDAVAGDDVGAVTADQSGGEGNRAIGRQRDHRGDCADAQNLIEPGQSAA